MKLFTAFLLSLPLLGFSLNAASAVSNIQSLQLIGVTESQESVKLAILFNGATIDLSGYNIDQLNILAQPVDESLVGSVHFSLQGPLQINRWENMADFTLEAETDNLRIKDDGLPVGKYKLAVTPYEGPDMEGEKGQTKEISFTVVDSKKPTPAVPAIIAADLVAVHEGTGSIHPITRINEGKVIDNSMLSEEWGNIVAISENSEKTGSVLFELDGPITASRIANSATYTLADEAEHMPLANGFTDGEYTLIVTPYAEPDAQGEAGVPLVVNFSIGVPGQEEEEITEAASEASNETIPLDNRPAMENGFTTIRPSKDSKLIYVSSSTGDDDNTCLSETSPCKTLRAGLAKMRNGYPDHLYLKRGDTWRNEQLIKLVSGRSEAEPAVIAYYGISGERPKLENSRTAFFAMNDSFANLHVIGLEFSAYQLVPEHAEFTGKGMADILLTGKNNDILFEDNKFSYTNVVVQSAENESSSNIRLRRNIWIGDTASYAKNEERITANLFMQNAIGVLLEENVFYPEKNASAVSIYVNENRDVEAHSNIFAGGTIQAPSEKEGEWFASNLFFEAEIAAQENMIQRAIKRPIGVWEKSNLLAGNAEKAGQST